ncbi:MAG TPA: hypothetical protein VGC41_15900 [Kofleriaceae bacterium]
MQKISNVLAAALSLASFSCAKKSAETQTSDKSHPVPECGRAIDNGAELQKAHMAGVDDKMKGKMKDVALSHCKDDKWSDDVLQCMTEAKSDTDFKACQGRLTADQKDSMQKSLRDLKTAAGAMAPAGGDGSAAAEAAEHP